MFEEEVETELLKKRLYVKYFDNLIWIEALSKDEAVNYLTTQAATLKKLANNFLKEADKYTDE